MNNADPFTDWEAFAEQTHYVWVDTPDGGETVVLPFKTISRLDEHHSPVIGFNSNVRLGYVLSDWWFEIGRHYVIAKPNAILDAAASGNAEDALERFVQDAEYWYEDVAG